MAYNDENNGYDSNPQTGYESNNINEPKENSSYNDSDSINNNYPNSGNNQTSNYDPNSNPEPDNNYIPGSNNNPNNNQNLNNGYNPNSGYNPNTGYNPNNNYNPNNGQNSNNYYNPNNDPNGSYNPYTNFPPYSQSNNYRKPASNGFATASLVIGILSLVLLCLPYVPFFIAPMGIILGLLSKKGHKKTNTTAKIGIGLSTGGFCVSIIVTAMLLVYSFSYMNMDAYKEFYEGIEDGYDMYDYQKLFDNLLEDLENY